MPDVPDQKRPEKNPYRVISMGKAISRQGKKNTKRRSASNCWNESRQKSFKIF